jgi:predicted dehydrogenase
MLQAGKHVLVEKPFTLSLEQACLLFQIAEQRKRILMAGHVMEYHSSVLWLKQYLKQGHLGQLFYLCFNRGNLGRVRQDVSVVWDLAVHDLAMLRYLIEEEPVAISAFGGCYLQPGIFDVVFITVHFAGNVVAQVHASWLESCKTRQAVVIGKKQMIKFDDVTNQDKIRIYDCGITSYGDVLETGSAGYRFVPRYGDIFLPAIPETEPLLQQCRHFVDCIYEDRGPVTGKPDTLWVTKAALLAEQSLRQGGSPLAFTT